MKKNIAVLLSLIIVFLAGPGLAVENINMIEIREFTGSVKIKKVGGEKFFSVFPGITLTEGDTIITEENSQMSLKLDRELGIKIAEQSRLYINQLSIVQAGQVENIKFILSKGKIWVNIGRNQNNLSKFKLKTPLAVLDVQKAKFYVGIGENGRTTIAVFKGMVVVNSELHREKVVLKQNQLLVLGKKQLNLATEKQKRKIIYDELVIFKQKKERDKTEEQGLNNKSAKEQEMEKDNPEQTGDEIPEEEPAEETESNGETEEEQAGQSEEEINEEQEDAGDAGDDDIIIDQPAEDADDSDIVTDQPADVTEISMQVDQELVFTIDENQQLIEEIVVVEGLHNFTFKIHKNNVGLADKMIEIDNSEDFSRSLTTNSEGIGQFLDLEINEGIYYLRIDGELIGKIYCVPTNNGVIKIQALVNGQNKPLKKIVLNDFVLEYEENAPLTQSMALPAPANYQLTELIIQDGEEDVSLIEPSQPQVINLEQYTLVNRIIRTGD